MEHTTYVREGDFEIARRNGANYAGENLSSVQGGGVIFRVASSGSFYVSSLSYYGEPRVPFAAQTENRPPLDTSGRREKFKQRTFLGKPLSDDATIHATRVASEIEDDS